MDSQLLDAAAKAFTRAFYLALAVGSTVANSFEIGKQAVASSPYVPNPSLEGEKFMLLPNDNSHDVPIFQTEYVKRWTQDDYCNCPDSSHIPQTPEGLFANTTGSKYLFWGFLIYCLFLDWEGRQVDMHRVITTLMATKRLVTLIGEQGKSSMISTHGDFPLISKRINEIY